MTEFFLHLFDYSDFNPRNTCGSGWNSNLVWLHIISDFLIWFAYLAIPCILVYYVRKRRDLPFPHIFWLFGAFILSCGTTHIVGMAMFNYPMYRLDGLIKMITAVVSLATVVALIPTTPRFLAMRSPLELEAEIAERRIAEEKLRAMNLLLEQKVAERTAGLEERARELSDANVKLRESEERLRMAQHAGNIGTFEWNIQTGMNRWTPELESLYGLAPGGFAGTQEAWERMLAPEDRALAVQRVKDALESDSGSFVHEWRVNWPDGSVHWLAGRAQVLKDNAGKPLRLLGVNIEITERKRAAAQIAADLKAMTRLHQVAARSAQPGVKLDELLGEFVEAAIAVTGAEKGNIQALDPASGTLKIAAHRGFTARFLEHFASVRDEPSVCGEAMRAGTRVVVEDVTKSPIFAGTQALEVLRGESICAVQSTPLVSSAGRLLGMLSTHSSVPRRPSEQESRLIDLLAHQAADLIERKKAEATLAERAEELSRSNADLEQFAYVASHDLKEPVRMVTNFAQLLEKKYKGRLDEQADKYIFYVVDNAKRMETLISDLLAYARVGRVEEPLERVDCGAVLKEVLAGLQPAIAEAGAQVQQDSLPMIMGHRTQLAQVFQNLVENAVKFRGEAPPFVQVGAQRQNEVWLFHVRDNGIGIDARYSTRIFKMFQRLHGQGKYPGTGIGLAIAKKVVERHGGKIWVESVPGGGSTFYFTLPQIGL